MALTPGRIHAGGAHIFTGVSLAATGTPPTYIGHTAGVPASGTEVGVTDGPAEFHYEIVKELIQAEQSLAPVDVFVLDEIAEISFTCKEQVYHAIQRAFDNVGTEDISAGEAAYFGGGTAILSPRTECVMLTSIQRNAPTKYIITVLYKAVNLEPLVLPFSKGGETMFQMRWRGLADLTRNAGDQVGYYRFETAA